MRIVDLLDPFYNFTKDFPRGSWEVMDGQVVFRTNEYLEDAEDLARYREMFI